MFDVFCAGQLVADILVKPVSGVDFSVDTQPVDVISVQSGGDCMNTAVALSKLGCTVAFAGKTGDDVTGRQLRDVLEANGIHTGSLAVSETEPSSSVIVLVNPEGERTFLYCAGTNATFCFEDIDLSLMEKSRIVHVGGAFMLPRFDGEGAARLFRHAKAAGKITTMDNSFDVTGRWLEILRPCLPHLDYFLPSVNEARLMTGLTNPEEIADAFLHEGVGHVIIKLGKQGGFYKDKAEMFYFPAYDVPVMDTTGAGDSFVAGFITALLDRAAPRRAVQFASAVSAYCIQSLGASAGIPGRSAVEAFIKQSPPILAFDTDFTPTPN